MTNETSTPENITAMTQEKKKIRREFRFIDMVFFTIAAILGIDTLGAVSSYGGQTLFWIVVTAIIFMLPYGLLTAELGSAFPMEGGVYEWGNRAYGRFYAALVSMFYWISNPLWIGGTMFVTAITAIKLFWLGNTNALIGGSKMSDAIFTIIIALAFIWATTLCVLLPMRTTRYVSFIGSAAKLGLLALFMLLALLFFLSGHASGAHLQFRDFLPTNDWTLIIGGIIPVLVFKWTGFEVQNGAGEEMENPQRDVPRSLLRAGIVALLSYTLPIFVILFALSKEQIATTSGFLQAIANVTAIVPAPLLLLLNILLVPAIIMTLLSSGATWMGGANRTYAIAALDHAVPRSLGHFSAKHGTPVVTTLLCGVISSIVMIAAVLITSFGGGSAQTLFGLVLGFSISINTLAYMLIFPCYIALRYKYPRVQGSYQVPGGLPGAWISTIITTALAAIASFFLIYPTDDVIAHSGVTRLPYELVQLGVLAGIIVLTVVFYLVGHQQERHEQRKTAILAQQKHNARETQAASTR